MNRKLIVVLIITVVCVVLVSTAAAQSDKPNAADVAVPAAFTYQGQIKRNSALFTGACDMQFKLWDAAAAGTQQGTTLNMSAVNVNNGVFSVALNFGNQFKGDARWVESAAKCADDVSFTTFPRVALNPTPYAIGLMPGAQMQGNIPGLPGILRVSNTGPGAALLGLATSTTGTTYGVLGNAFSPNGFAVFGYSAFGAVGVRGESSGQGVGVWGSSVDSYGVYGESTNLNGVLGVSHNPAHGAVAGVHDGGGIAVYGRSTTNVGYAGYFDGKVGIAGGSDLAELFNVSEDKAEPGALLIIDAARPGQLTISTRAYDTKVAGIVSGAGGVNPGLTLHQDGVMDGDTHVAIAGRVYVKATASNGAIEPGDLLTTSDVIGHAMKATDSDRSHGAIIGKAMTGLKDGTGLVLVLVNLQ